MKVSFKYVNNGKTMRAISLDDILGSIDEYLETVREN